MKSFQTRVTGKLLSQKTVIISEDRRLIVVDTEHMTGQGAQGDVLVLGCRDGKITALLHQTFNRSVALEEASADKLVLKFSRWESCDPVCCPSTEVREVYVWSKDGQDYVLDREIAKSFAQSIVVNPCRKKSQ